jgi:hypothetical protein
MMGRNRWKIGMVFRALSGVVAGAVFLAVATSAAWADGPCDGRASYHGGIVKTCSSIGFPGDYSIGSASNGNAKDGNVLGWVRPNTGGIHSGQGQELDVSLAGSNKASIVIDAVVVDGSHGYNPYRIGTYLPPHLNGNQHYVPPFDGFGQIPDIGRWFICYHFDPGTGAPEFSAPVVLPVVAAAAFGGFMIVQRRRNRSAAA